MVELALISVPHTGTNLIERILREHGFGGVGLNRPPEKERAYHVGHMTSLSQVQMALRLGKDMPIVCPLRHPYRVEESWRRRTKDLNHGYYEAWSFYMHKFVPADCFVFPVDVPERDQYLVRLGELIGVELQTDWPLCRSVAGTHDLPLDETQPSEGVVTMVSDMDWFLSRYY